MSDLSIFVLFMLGAVEALLPIIGGASWPFALLIAALMGLVVVLLSGLRRGQRPGEGET